MRYFRAYYSKNDNNRPCRGEQVRGITITVEDRYWMDWKRQSCKDGKGCDGQNPKGYYKAPDGYVFTGREHRDDENGDTRWEVGRVYVSNGKTKKPVTMYSPTNSGKYGEHKGENDYGWSGKNGAYIMTGYYHTGDEKDPSWYTSAKAKVDLY